MPAAESTPPSLRPVQRTAAYGVVSDGSGGVLLLRVPGGRDPAGRWSLPGGVVRHGEHPRDRVRAGLLEQTGLRAASITPRDASADVVELPGEGVSVHTLRLLFDVTLHGRPAGIGGPGRVAVVPDEDAGPASRLELDRLPGEDPVVTPPPSALEDPQAPVAVVVPPDPDRPVAQFVGRFMAPGELRSLPLAAFLSEALLEDAPVAAVSRGDVDLLDPPMDAALLLEPAVAAPDPGESGSAEPDPAQEVPVFVQRPAAYAVLVDEDAPDGPRMLLSRLAGSANTWTLPGGGIDHGEHPRPALRREIHEEAGLAYTAGPLVDISSRHFVGRAPHGRLEDFHALRLIYAGSVPLDEEPHVVEVDGSTDEAAWIRIADLDTIGAVPTAHEALAAWRAHRDGAGDGAGVLDETVRPGAEESGA
ncbi:NUDIX domain-containing protein [Kineosporia succinea]|uniref:ADP-ribose pyrophosphatase YjhB (NUDIX family) n=1 Tax=Kineosporia succinea TaxID=84632 RepID=A0ABT9P3I6_9ACTN|nr:NUDIX domain-containing protein [Kineosporia succinea]MDP9827260.1 ADP-ribose pyrophosphatase YjhB (NUDIX family) [Kineosporia succinea]